MTKLRDVPLALWRAHQALPRPLRLQWIVPGTFLFVTVTGLFIGLPSGPLCDEEMVLFMEGGCDMGHSNVFFFSKLGMLVVLTGALSLAWRKRVTGFAPFLPHFCVAVALAWVNRSGGECDTYYSHPNGSVGQMVVEIAAFAAVGIMMLNQWVGGSSRRLVAAMAGWHGLYIGAFYAWLAYFPHWTWSHTWAVSLSMLVFGTVSTSITGKPAAKPIPARAL